MKNYLHLNHFQKPAINLGDKEVLLFSCLRNEYTRLAYFLEYYREIGVKCFIIVDNGSTDGSYEFLEQQNDVILFRTFSSYRGSCAGRLWLQELCDFYGHSKWCLTVDVDELLVWPGCEGKSIQSLCAHMEARGQNALLCIFLDMYSRKSIDDVNYIPGDPFIKHCEYFEKYSYFMKLSQRSPYLGVYGGPRARRFQAAGKLGPMMKKVPLVRWHHGFSYVYSTHSLFPSASFSSILGALLHFKFFNTFVDLVESEVRRGDRRQTQDYLQYSKSITSACSFFSEKSIRYVNSFSLVDAALSSYLCSDSTYVGKVSPCNSIQSESLRESFYNGESLEMDKIHILWPSIHDYILNRKYILPPKIASTGSLKLAERYHKNIRLIEFNGGAGKALLQIDEDLIYSNVFCNAVVVFVLPGSCFMAILKDSAYVFDSHIPNIYRVNLVLSDLQFEPLMARVLKDRVKILACIAFMKDLPFGSPPLFNNYTSPKAEHLSEFDLVCDPSTQDERKQVVTIDKVSDSYLYLDFDGLDYSSVKSHRLNLYCSSQLVSSSKIRDLMLCSRRSSHGFRLKWKIPLSFFYENASFQFNITITDSLNSYYFSRLPVSVRLRAWDFEYLKGKWVPVYWGSLHRKPNATRDNTLLHLRR